MSEPNYQMREQHRISDYQEIGNISQKYGTTNEILLGENNEFDRKLNNIEQTGNIINNNVFNPNNNSYNIYDNQRNLTKVYLLILICICNDFLSK
jgi:uncharacterized protein YfkK (UPF0435 family)